MSIAFVIGYFALLGVIILIEASDSVNMKQGENSMMGEFKILIGVMTGAIAQILNFWFSKADTPGGSITAPQPPISAAPPVSTEPVNPIGGA